MTTNASTCEKDWLADHQARLTKARHLLSLTGQVPGPGQVQGPGQLQRDKDGDIVVYTPAAYGEHLALLARCGLDQPMDWQMASAWEWAHVLREYPQHYPRYQQHAEGTTAQIHGGLCWAHVLEKQPQFAHLCHCWEDIQGDALVGLLKCQPTLWPQLRRLRELSGAQWAQLLDKQPQLVKQLPPGTQLHLRDARRLAQKYPAHFKMGAS